MNSVIQNSTGTYEVIFEGNKYLGIATGLENEIMKTIERASFLSIPGLLWSEGEINKWNILKVTIHNKEIVPLGSWLKGETLADKEIKPSHLYNLSQFFLKLREKETIPETLIPSGIYFTENHGILIFPENIIDLIISHQDENYRMEFIDSYNHPELKGEKALCFFLGVIAYRMIAGELPFSGKNLTELRESIRISKPVPMEFKVPGFKKEFSSLIMASLSPGKRKITLEDWTLLLDDWLKNGHMEDISQQQTEEIISMSKDLEKKRNRSFKRKLFFAKYWKRIAVITGTIVILTSIISTPVKNALAPPVTMGLSAEKVVALYYSSYNNLDIEVMGDCTEKGAGKEDIREITGIFVISKVRSGYEGKSGLIRADVWLKSKQKELNGGENLYGLTDIKIRKITEDTFRAEYDKWSTEYPSDTTETEAVGTQIKTHTIDILHLKKNKKAWVIDNIIRSTDND